MKKTLASICGLLMSVSASACVENESNAFGATVTNRCNYPVNVSYCFGAGCTPPAGSRGGPSINPGFSRKISTTPNVHFVLAYCPYPSFPDGESNCVRK